MIVFFHSVTSKQVFNSDTCKDTNFFVIIYVVAKILYIQDSVIYYDIIKRLTIKMN